ncbi:MAG: response regulator [Desulfobacterales bacterium]|nr:response regulator [Desulfobacterales bacterium]
METILIIDDNVEDADVLSEYMTSEGFKALVHADGRSAVETVRRVRPDIILLDVKMPGIGGFEICGHLKKHGATRDIPVIFMTGLTGAGDEVKGLGLGAVDYITKPVNIVTMMARIKTHLAFHKLQKSYQERNTRLQREIAGRERAEEELARRNEALHTLHEVTLDIRSDLEMPTLLRRIMLRAAELLDAELGGGIYMYDGNEKVLRLVEGSGENQGRIGRILQLDDGVAGRVFETARPFFVNDYNAWEGRVPSQVSRTPLAVLGAPLILEDRVIGVLGLLAEAGRRTFTRQDAQMVEMFASQAATAIESVRLYERLADKNRELARTLEELRDTQKQLVESEKMASLGALVAGVAHEINTPVGVGVTAASSLVDMNRRLETRLMEGALERDDLDEHLHSSTLAADLILRNLRRTGELVKNFMRVAVDHHTENKRRFKMKSYIQDVIRAIKPMFKDKRIRVEIRCDENLELNSYPGLFIQILTNFLQNSVNHGFKEKSEGEIEIRAESENNTFSLRYQDNGRGIPRNVLPKIFDPFFTTDKQKGTGLGLHIVYNIVTQKLQGSINCISDASDGVLFTITAPMGD